MDPIIGLYVRDVVRLAARLLPLRLVYFACEFYARLRFFLNDSAHFVRSVSRYFSGLGADEVRRLTRDLFIRWQKTLLDFIICGGLPREKIERMVTPVRLRYIAEALALGRGVILLSMHTGTVPIAFYLAGRGYKVNYVTTRRTHSFLQSLYGERINVVSTFEEMKQCLKRNEVLILYIDGRKGRRPIRIRLLGKELLFAPGVVVLARKTGAAVVPFIGLHQKGAWLRFILQRMIDLDHTDLGNPDRMREELQKCVDPFEPYILRNPDNFYVFLKTREATDFHISKRS